MQIIKRCTADNKLLFGLIKEEYSLLGNMSPARVMDENKL